MDVHDTTLMTDVQYLAPLMAYFSPKLHRDSQVLTLDDGNCRIPQIIAVLQSITPPPPPLKNPSPFGGNI